MTAPGVKQDIMVLAFPTQRRVACFFFAEIDIRTLLLLSGPVRAHAFKIA
jgi:hypothetical protein